ncbi:hypothetical protein EJ06DRAFT_395846 [Trichodelitschia bisporula]|uniref:Zn(2)-C6 fungal-type domain-containing protein n=1 Tax=Trichodelitschia bisporula TaxID=703511 RepID=A0A6G1HZU5_9PEZI|nr:hypothetical protein EJ06DRAFT_395846 [Trichodelitschia bisporula]
MRSSIACARCRRSKVKCVNNGVNTTCRACETSGRECTYPQPAVTGASMAAAREAARREISGGPDTSEAHHPPKRQRVKRILPSGHTGTKDVSTKESMRAIVDALDPTLLKPHVWVELFDIWNLHYSTDLPFIHHPTFLKQLRQLTPAGEVVDFNSPRPDRGSTMPPAPDFWLLGFLALTAKFHLLLVTHHSPRSATRPSNPLIASHYYASACRVRLAMAASEDAPPDLHRIQALQMLAFHDWMSDQGLKAWSGTGTALRYAQSLGLHIEASLDDEPDARCVPLHYDPPDFGGESRRSSSVTSIAFIESEVARRTFWSVFIFDRALSNSKYRPSVVHPVDVHVQLPSSEQTFTFGRAVRTACIVDKRGGHGTNGSAKVEGEPGHSRSKSLSHEPTDEGGVPWEQGPNEGVVSRYVKAIDLYGKILLYADWGGRKREVYPPYSPHSSWAGLHAQLSAFRTSLPRELTLNPDNISAHITSRTSTSYIALHSVLLLCGVMLNRDLVSFLPLRTGPADGPTDQVHSSTEDAKEQKLFWETGARELFRSARDLVDLQRICQQEWNIAVETPIVGFSVYLAALIGVYAINFPWMDPNGYMSQTLQTPNPPPLDKASTGLEAARFAMEVLSHLRARLPKASGWLHTLAATHRYFMRTRRDFKRAFCVYGDKTMPGLAEGRDDSRGIEIALRDVLPQTDADDVLDDEMPDAPDGESFEEEDPEDKPITVAPPPEGRQDKWNAINASAPAAPPPPHAPAHQSTNGAHGHGSFPRRDAPLPVRESVGGPPASREQAEAWFDGLPMYWGADDWVAFADGGEIKEWLARVQERGRAGWLGTVFEGR